MLTYALGFVYKQTGQNQQAIVANQHLKTLSPTQAQSLFDAIVPK